MECSIYSPNQLDNSININLILFKLHTMYLIEDLSKWLARYIYKNNVEVHIRSVFLQGLLLMDEFSRPNKLIQWNNIWDKWEA